ncbi:hypothetical protein SAMN02927924_01668 [Sphingobium faniae]|nr:hypothetical protein SAMN02927924_01668 [Sphingobium faniae]
MTKRIKYIVVEKSGMVGEHDVGTFGTYSAALNWMERNYSESERDHTHRNCLFPDVCVEVDGERSYDV